MVVLLNFILCRRLYCRPLKPFVLKQKNTFKFVKDNNNNNNIDVNFSKYGTTILWSLRYFERVWLMSLVAMKLAVIFCENLAYIRSKLLYGLGGEMV